MKDFTAHVKVVFLSATYNIHHPPAPNYIRKNLLLERLSCHNCWKMFVANSKRCIPLSWQIVIKNLEGIFIVGILQII